MNYTPPGMPLNVSWEGSDAYTAPGQPVDVSWEPESGVIIGTFATTIPAPIPPITVEARERPAGDDFLWGTTVAPVPPVQWAEAALDYIHGVATNTTLAAPVPPILWFHARERSIDTTLAVTIPAPVPPVQSFAAALDYIHGISPDLNIPAPVPPVTLAATLEQNTDLPQDVDGPSVSAPSRHLSGKTASPEAAKWLEALRVRTPLGTPTQQARRTANRNSFPAYQAQRIRRPCRNAHGEAIRLQRGMGGKWYETQRTSRTIRERYTEAIRLRRGTGFPWFETGKLRNRLRWDEQEAQQAANRLGTGFAQALQTRTPLHQPWTHMIWPQPGRWWPFYVPPSLSLVIPCSGGYTPRPLECSVLLHWQPIEQPYCPGLDPEPPIDGPIIITAGSVLLMVHDIQLFRTSDGAPIAADNLQITLDMQSFAWGFSADLLDVDAYALVQPTSSGPVDLTMQIDGQQFRVLAEETSDTRRGLGKPGRRITGRSLSAQLAAPYAAPRSFIETTGKTVQQLAADELQFTGWTLEWIPPDWFVPGGVWGYSGKTPLEAIAAIADAAGAFIYPDPSSPLLRVLSRYPESSWHWPTATPDFVIDANPIKSISQRWIERPAYNKAFVLGAEQGILVEATRQGTAGNKPAPEIQHPLITHVDGGQERARVELSEGGKMLAVTLTLPYMGSPHGPGLVPPGALLQVNDPLGTWRGLVQGTSILARGAIAEQTLQIERRWAE